MINVPVYSQRDKRWANKKLGFSNKTIGNYGCTITSLASLLSHVYNEKFYPDRVNDDLKGVGAFVGALVLWSKVEKAYPRLRWIKRAYNYNNAEVAWSVYVKKVPVLVEVNGAKIGAPRHWVLFVGGRQAMDPWFGRMTSTGTYPTTGYSLFKTA